MERASGILMPISSLPSPYGIGTLGGCARQFADFLKGAGQKYWQVLPVGPTSYGDSPYQSFSAFAGNPYFIEFDELEKEGLLEKHDYENINWGRDPGHVDYALLYENRYAVLEKAFLRGYDRDVHIIRSMPEKYPWLNDYALFMALKEKFGGTVWSDWPDEGLVMRDPATLERYKKELRVRIEFWKYVQHLFFKQWKALKSYVNSLGIKLIGDMPIYVAMDSADTWSSPELFDLDARKRPNAVAGCPPDYFSATGQLWGNPLYDWDAMASNGYSWWAKRIAAMLDMYDVVRIDHFRAFDTYYAIPFGAKTAAVGEWRNGPGMKLFNALKNALGDVPIIAEDLGYLCQSARDLRKATGFPGMKLLEFAFDSNEKNDYLPHSYDSNCVVYIGTHDNNTVNGWLADAPESDARHAREYMALTESEGVNWGFIRTAFGSVADLAVVQLQDVLGLPAEARMNTPSTLGGTNWQWRLAEGALTEELRQRLAGYTRMYER